MKNKFLLISGGTGGHVVPAENFANYCLDKNVECRLILDKRGSKYINSFDGKIYIVNSSNLSGNLFSKIFGTMKLILGFFESFFLIMFYKPTTVISFGSYASFFPMCCCIFFKLFYKLEIYVHEQNSILGWTNNFFISFTNNLSIKL